VYQEQAGKRKPKALRFQSFKTSEVQICGQPDNLDTLKRLLRFPGSYGSLLFLGDAG